MSLPCSVCCGVPPQDQHTVGEFRRECDVDAAATTIQKYWRRFWVVRTVVHDPYHPYGRYLAVKAYRELELRGVE